MLQTLAEVQSHVGCGVRNDGVVAFLGLPSAPYQVPGLLCARPALCQSSIPSASGAS